MEKFVPVFAKTFRTDLHLVCRVTVSVGTDRTKISVTVPDRNSEVSHDYPFSEYGVSMAYKRFNDLCEIAQEEVNKFDGKLELLKNFLKNRPECVRESE